MRGKALLASAHHEASGGVWVIDPAGPQAIDRLSTRGLAVRGDQLYRLISAQNGAQPASDLLVYDAAGLRSFHRLDGVWDAHDVLPRADEVLIVASSDAAVYAVRADCAPSRSWGGGPSERTRYVNCLCEADGEVFATEFGAYDPRDRRDPDEPSGRIFHLRSGRTVVGGLRQPHNPRRVGANWVVCDSRTREVREYDDAGCLRRSRRLAGFTRGIAIDDDCIYVGESTGHDCSFSELQRARISILDRSTWDPIATIDLDVPEIYDLAIVSQPVLAGFRAASQLPLPAERSWLVSDPLALADRRATVRLTLPPSMHVRDIVTLPCRIANHGDAQLASAPPNPVQLCYRWFDERGAQSDANEWIHSDLPRPLAAGEEVDAALRVMAPPLPGRYVLTVALLQEGVAWFDDVDPANATRGQVVVERMR